MQDAYVVYFLDTEEGLKMFDLFELTKEADEPIGIDSEWRPSMNVFHESQGPSIVQLSDSKTCLILDMLALKKLEVFSQRLA